jgi:hypothetical protein
VRAVLRVKCEKRVPTRRNPPYLADPVTEEEKIAFMESDTQEIGSCPVGTGAVPVLMLAVAGATIKWPSLSHA